MSVPGPAWHASVWMLMKSWSETSGGSVQPATAVCFLLFYQWKDDVPHGRISRVVYPDGSIYAGDFLRGNREGHGTLVLDSVVVYDGLWVDDVPHGRGTFISSELSKNTLLACDPCRSLALCIRNTSCSPRRRLPDRF